MKMKYPLKRHNVLQRTINILTEEMTKDLEEYLTGRIEITFIDLYTDRTGSRIYCNYENKNFIIDMGAECVKLLFGYYVIELTMKLSTMTDDSEQIIVKYSTLLLELEEFFTQFGFKFNKDDFDRYVRNYTLDPFTRILRKMNEMVSQEKNNNSLTVY